MSTNANWANIDTKYAKCDKRVKKTEALHRDQEKLLHKAEITLIEHKVSLIAPQILLAAQKLPAVELKLKVAEYEQQRQIDERKRLEVKHLDARKSEIRLKKENKQLTKTVESLTAQLEGKASPEEQSLKTENDKLKEQLALLKAQLQNKTEECEAKDSTITDLTKDCTTKALVIKDLCDDFAAYQNVTSDTWGHRHDGCDELVAALEEQCGMLTTERNTLEGNINTLYHKLNTVAIERDNLQSKFDESIKAHQLELEDVDAFKCEGSSGCTSCVVRLERALRISRSAEVQALQLVDQVNHDRMVAWNQLHEYQMRVVQEHYAAVGSWVAGRQAPSVSSTLVSPTFKPSESGNDGWKISDVCGSSDSSSVDFSL